MKVTVLYDGGCAICERCRAWCESEAQYVKLHFVNAHSPVAQEWANAAPEMGAELVVVDDSGRVWVGPEAFLVCLWSLVRFRSLAFTLSDDLLPLTRTFFRWISTNRGAIGTFLAPFGLDTRCSDGHCARPPALGVYR